MKTPGKSSKVALTRGLDRVFWVIMGALIIFALGYVGAGIYAAKQRDDIRSQPRPGLNTIQSTATPS